MRKFKTVDQPPYTVDPAVVKPFARGSNAFARPRSQEHARLDGDPCEQPAPDATSQAASVAARRVYKHLGAFLGADSEAASKSAAGGTPPSDAAANTAMVKAAARSFGADLVGVARLNPLWLYADNAKETRWPETCNWVVVMAVAMDPAAIRESPAAAAAAATSVGYMRMGVCAAALGGSISELGAQAVASGNDTGLSIPLAIDAGLGEMGRNGMLITPRFGPCVRLCKVFTDLPLVADKPIDLDLSSSCADCTICARTCPANAIDAGPEPSFEVVCGCNNPGVLRWPVDAVACRAFWGRNGGSCANCIASCPFTPY